MPLSFEKLRLQHFDPDALSHALDSTEIEHRLLAGGSLNVHSQQLRWGDLSVSVCSYGFPVLVRGGMPSENGVFIGLLGRASGEVSLNLRSLPLDQILLYAPGSEAHYHARAGSEWMMLRLPLDRLQEEAASRHRVGLNWPRQGVRQVDIPSVIGARLRGELRGLLQFGERFTGMLEAEVIQPLVRDGLLQLAAKAIACSSRPFTPKLSVGRARALNAMESYIDSWLTDPEGRPQMADIAGSSHRLLQMASREIYGMTPHRWTNLARLNAAYRELSKKERVSVTDLCEKLGFGNMGKFAAEYRRLFGETPRETLLRR